MTSRRSESENAATLKPKASGQAAWCYAARARPGTAAMRVWHDEGVARSGGREAGDGAGGTIDSQPTPRPPASQGDPSCRWLSWPAEASGAGPRADHLRERSMGQT
jgi:hypothetical protein